VTLWLEQAPAKSTATVGLLIAVIRRRSCLGTHGALPPDPDAPGGGPASCGVPLRPPGVTVVVTHLATRPTHASRISMARRSDLLSRLRVGEDPLGCGLSCAGG
jgi:hypothetical protein